MDGLTFSKGNCDFHNLRYGEKDGISAGTLTFPATKG